MATHSPGAADAAVSDRGTCVRRPWAVGWRRCLGIIVASALVAGLPGTAAAAGSAPQIAADASSVTVDENHLAKLFGDWSDPDGDAVEVTASIGWVDTEWNGRWEWSYPAMDGPLDASVTLTATDSNGASTSIDFELHVNNVAPTARTSGPAFVPLASASPRWFHWTVVDVPGDVTDPTATCGSGTVVETVPGRISGTMRTSSIFPVAGATKVGPQATDKDGASVDGRMQTIVTPAVTSMADARIQVDGGADGQYLGSALAVADLDADGYGDVAIGSAAQWHQLQSGDPGVVPIVRGRAGGASLDLGALPAGAGWTITGPPNVRFGHALAPAGDVNGDGVRDLVIGSMTGAWVVFGGAGFTDLDVRTMSASRGYAITGTGTTHPEAATVEGVGDVNADGFDDVAVAVPGPDIVTETAAVAVILGRTTGDAVDVSALAQDRGFVIRAAGGQEVRDIAGGDVNGDGRADVAVATRQFWGSGVTVVYGKASPVSVDGAQMTASQGYVIGAQSRVDPTAIAIGDMNRDGFAELAIAHDGNASAPDAWSTSVIRGAAANADIPYLETAPASRLIRVDTGVAGVPTRLAMGDVSGDGRADLLLGTPWPQTNEDDPGSAYILRGASTLSTVSFDVLDPRWSRVDGDEPQSIAGSGVATGDVTGDRVADVIVGAEGATNWAGVSAGRVAVVAGTHPTDTTPPTVAAPVVTLPGSGTVRPLVPLRIAWSASDSKTGVSGYEVHRQIDGGAWATIGPVTVYSAVLRSYPTGHDYRFRIRATDGAGNRSAWRYGTTVHLTGRGDTSPAISWTGTWAKATSPEWWDGTVRYAGTAGKRASLSFTGRGVVWVAGRGPDRGKARVYVDGALVQTVDLQASTLVPATIVFRRSWSSSSSHSIRVEIAGTAGRPRVDVDGFVVLR